MNKIIHKFKQILEIFKCLKKIWTNNRKKIIQTDYILSLFYS